MDFGKNFGNELYSVFTSYRSLMRYPTTTGFPGVQKQTNTVTNLIHKSAMLSFRARDALRQSLEHYICSNEGQQIYSSGELDAIYECLRKQTHEDEATRSNGREPFLGDASAAKQIRV